MPQLVAVVDPNSLAEIGFQRALFTYHILLNGASAPWNADVLSCRFADAGVSPLWVSVLALHGL